MYVLLLSRPGIELFEMVQDPLCVDGPLLGAHHFHEFRLQFLDQLVGFGFIVCVLLHDQFSKGHEIIEDLKD